MIAIVSIVNNLRLRLIIEHQRLSIQIKIKTGNQQRLLHSYSNLLEDKIRTRAFHVDINQDERFTLLEEHSNLFICCSSKKFFIQQLILTSNILNIFFAHSFNTEVQKPKEASKKVVSSDPPDQPLLYIARYNHSDWFSNRSFFSSLLVFFSLLRLRARRRIILECINHQSNAL